MRCSIDVGWQSPTRFQELGDLRLQRETAFQNSKPPGVIGALMIAILSGTPKSTTPPSTFGIRVSSTGILPASQAIGSEVRACFPN